LEYYPEYLKISHCIIGILPWIFKNITLNVLFNLVHWILTLSYDTDHEIFQYLHWIFDFFIQIIQSKFQKIQIKFKYFSNILTNIWKYYTEYLKIPHRIFENITLNIFFDLVHCIEHWAMTLTTKLCPTSRRLDRMSVINIITCRLSTVASLVFAASLAFTASLVYYWFILLFISLVYCE
jgi:hypothetical protein